MATDKSTRERLLDAALDLVAADGVQAVSHRTVEQRAGVARGSTRYHFGSRDDLLAALIGHVADRDHALMAQAVAEHAVAIGDAVDDATNQAMLISAAQALLADRDGALARFELYLYAARRPALRDVVARWSRTFTDVGAAHLSGQGVEQPATGAALLSAAFDGVVLHSLVSDKPATDELGRAMFALVAAVSGQRGHAVLAAEDDWRAIQEARLPPVDPRSG